MNLYQDSRPFYCGIDLHAKQMYSCVIDQAGTKHLRRNYKTNQSDKFFRDIEPFSKADRDAAANRHSTGTGRLTLAARSTFPSSSGTRCT